MFLMEQRRGEGGNGGWDEDLRVHFLLSLAAARLPALLAHQLQDLHGEERAAPQGSGLRVCLFSRGSFAI